MLVVTTAATLLRSGDIALQAAEFGQLAAGGDSIGAIADMDVSKNGRDLIVDGHIAAGAAKRFEAVLNAHPGIRRIVLTSPGGRVLEAERIAAMIRERGLDTQVDAVCMSACTNILLAGHERTAEESARVGFHAPSFPGFNKAEMRNGVATMREAYLAAGVHPYFVERALITPAESMWFPSYEELESAGVLTGSDIIVRGGGPAPSVNPAGLQRELQAAAAQMNAAGPIRLDDYTRFDRATASGLTLTRAYTVSTRNVDVKAASAAMTKAMREDACNQPRVAAAIRGGARFVHAYRSSGGRHLFDVEIARCPKA
jgi:hypothetical protein